MEMTDSLLTSSKEVAATQNRFNRAKGSALGLPLFLCSPEIYPSLSHHFSDFTLPAIAI